MWVREPPGAMNPLPMYTDELSHSAHLFTLRIWLEELGDGQSEWRTQVQHVSSGEVQYFRDWQRLVAWLAQMLSQPESGQNT